MAILTAMLEMMREDPDGQEDGDSTPEVLQKLAAKGGDFAEALQKVPPGSCVLTFGEVRETLGSTRLELIQFLLAMLRSGCACLQPAWHEAEFLTVPHNCSRSAYTGGECAHDCLTMRCLVCLTVLHAGQRRLLACLFRARSLSHL